jgi:hypothetical protein
MGGSRERRRKRGGAQPRFRVLRLIPCKIMETTRSGALYCSINRRITRLVLTIQITDSYTGIHIHNYISIQCTIWLCILTVRIEQWT